MMGPDDSATTLEPSPQETPGGDRVREHTDDDRLADLDEATRDRVRAYLHVGDEQLSARIEELENESDMERVLETNASILALAGIGAGVLLDRRLLAIPAIVTAFLLQHARQGWCPPIPIFRRFGVRTRQEIDAEKYALKTLRGDFDRLVAERGTRAPQPAPATH